jgi:hypothetical protein
MTVFMCCGVPVAQPKFHPDWILHRPVCNTEANQENIKALYSNLESTSAQIKESA